MTALPEALLAIDLGTSSVKCVLVARDGEILDIVRGDYQTQRPHQGWSEQDPQSWWDATTSAIQTLAQQHPSHRIAAISLTGQMHGTVVLDRNGDSIGPAIIWSDRRSVTERDDIAAEIGESLPIRIGGPLGVGYQATTLRWLATHQSEIADRIAFVLLPKDALAYRLTGIAATEPSDAISTGLLDAESWTWNPDMLRAAHVDSSWLPMVVPSGSTIGELRSDLASVLGIEPGIPVLLAGGDAPCAAFGADVTSADEAMIVLSSGAQVILPTSEFAPDPKGRWHTFASAVGNHGTGEQRNRVGATSNAGIALEWLAQVTGTTVKATVDRAATIPPGANGALFIPHLTGQRTPVVDPRARGSFHGLSDRHGPADLACAVVEGIILACRQVFETIVGDGSRPVRIRLGGGPSQHPFVRQTVANVFGIPVQPMESPDLTAIGAARSAALTMGWADPLATRPDLPVIQPDPASTDLYDRLYGIHVEAAESSRRIAHQLQAL